MKKKYMVGFFLALFCMVLLVSAGYAASYRYVMQRQEARVEEAEKREEDFLQQSVMTEGDATKKTSGYYLKELTATLRSIVRMGQASMRQPIFQ